MMLRLVLAAVLAVTMGLAQARKPHADGAPGQFDYYALSLSWSPSFCATHDDVKQCGAGRRLGFVLHGLWPQYERGFPQSCSSERLPPRVKDRYAGMFPSPSLISHEWPKHGTCSGLEPDAYFALTEKLKDSVVIPSAYQAPASPVRADSDALARAFRAANPAMPANAVLPFCGSGGRFLAEVRVCFSKAGAAQSCSTGEIKRSANSCRQGSFVLPNVR
ncbi:MAG: ribonuclease [Pseudomonadota bacterium]